MCLCVSDSACLLSRKSVLDGIRSNGILLFIMKGICDDMNKKIKTPEVEQLFKGMLCLKSVEECYEFFEDIKTILGPLTDKYFHKDADLNLEAIYTTLFSKEDTFVQEVLENVMKQFHMSADLFPDAPKADQASLREFTFICMLSLDIYLRNSSLKPFWTKNKGMPVHSFIL